MSCAIHLVKTVCRTACLQAQGERHFPEVDLLSTAGSGECKGEGKRGEGGRKEGEGGAGTYNHPGELYEILTFRPWLTN